MYGETLELHVSISNDSREEFSQQINFKIDFPNGHFMLPSDIGSLKSLHAGGIWTKSFGPNSIYKILGFFAKKWLTIFDKVSTLFWKTFLRPKQ